MRVLAFVSVKVVMAVVGLKAKVAVTVWRLMLETPRVLVTVMFPAYLR